MLSCTKNHSIFFIVLNLGFFVTRLRTLLLRRTSSVAFDISGKPTRCFATSFALVIILFLSYKFCAGDFSEMTRSIFFKCSGLMPNHMNFIPPEQFLKIHFRSEVIVVLRFLKVNFVGDVSQK